MDQKRVFKSFAVFAVGATVIAVGVFYALDVARIARGLKPVLLKAPQSITEILPPTEEDAMTEGGEARKNETNMPLKLPAEFSISIFAKDLKNPRVMMWGPDGNIWVSIPSQGKVVSLRDTNGDGVADEDVVVAQGLNRPHGLASRCDIDGTCDVYIAESDQVAVYDFDAAFKTVVNKKKLVDLPDGGRHFTRTLMFLPASPELPASASQRRDGQRGEPYPDENTLLISVGSSCDVCHEEDVRRAKILALDVKTGEVKEFAKGLRNSVFMAIHPVNGKVWATEMGRDMLSDDLPPDEINIIEEGKNYGWPICYGKNAHDVAFDKNTYIRNPCMEPFETPSYIDLPAHSAPLGLAFFPEEGWPQEYWYNLLVAYHGSWNRSEPTGYKLVRFILDAQGNHIGTEDFISGWLEGERAFGRPVDILIQPGGVIFVSDDKAGVIYRITYKAKEDSVTEHIQSKADLIHVASPGPGEMIQSPLMAQGEARGYWFFEASFPIHLLDGNGKELTVGIAQAQKEWMTTEFVPFSTTMQFQKPQTETGTLVFKKDNPSGLPEHDDELRIPVLFSR